MCHSENRYDDKQNKNRWRMRNLASVNIDMGTYKNRPVRKKHRTCLYSETKYGDKQNKNRWGLAKLWTPLGKHIRQETERSLVCKTVSRNLQL